LTTELGSTAKVTADSDLADCAELDSVGLLTLAVGLEDHFRIKLGEEDAPGLRTVRDVVRLVNRRRAEARR
jgi:acyl carrier protein